MDNGTHYLQCLDEVWQVCIKVMIFLWF